MRKRKRWFSFLLAVCLILSMTPGAGAVVAQPDLDAVKQPLPESNCGVPVYFQNDYPDVPYGDGTMATSGCGPTCLAMVATYLTGYTYTPDMIADFFPGKENNVQRMDLGSEELNLPWRRAADINEAITALKEGDVVIAFMGPTSLFTESQHFLTFAGITEEGKILVNDPMKPHYTNPILALGLREGFTRGQLVNGFGGGWIYDVSAMEEPKYQHTPYVKPRYPYLELSARDKRLIAQTMLLEAGDKDPLCQQAIAEVLLNRMLNWGFPDTLPGVLYCDNRFSGPLYRSAVPDLKPTRVQYEILEKAYSGPYILNDFVVYYGSVPRNESVWGSLDGIVFCHYF